MNQILSNPHLVRGIYTAVPLLTAAYICNDKEGFKLFAGLTGVAAAAVIAFSYLAATFNPLVAGTCVGAGIGVIFGICSDRYHRYHNLFASIIEGAVIGGAIGFSGLALVEALGSLKVTGYAFVNGQFVPVFAAS
jgi:hypothetical protein